MEDLRYNNRELVTGEWVRSGRMKLVFLVERGAILLREEAAGRCCDLVSSTSFPGRNSYVADFGT